MSGNAIECKLVEAIDKMALKREGGGDGEGDGGTSVIGPGTPGGRAGTGARACQGIMARSRFVGASAAAAAAAVGLLLPSLKWHDASIIAVASLSQYYDTGE